MYDPTKPYKRTIQDAIQTTWQSPYATAYQLKGSPYPFVERSEMLKNITDVEIDHTDGIGTKGIVHAMSGTWDFAVQDALAMNLNDLLVARARPYKLQNHLTMQYDDQSAVVSIIDRLARECKERNIVLTGGETSIHDSMIGMDLSLTVTAFVPEVLRNEFQPGDILIGLPSTGIHSNGFTFVRKYLGCRRDMATPTKIYWDDAFRVVLDEWNAIHGMVHIAGGAYTRLLDFVPGNTIRLKRWKNQPAIFAEIVDYCRQIQQITPPWPGGSLDKMMYTTFNCGIGFILSVSPEKSQEIATLLKGEIIGTVEGDGGNRLLIESIFSDSEIEFK